MPGALALQLISPAQGYSDWFRRVMTKVAFWFFLAALAAGLFLALVPSGARTNFFEELDFDMKGGWASNLTTAGAVLGTVLSAGLLPDDPFFMSKSQYIALNVVFALALILAYLIYRLFPHGVVLLFAGAIVLAAAAGEIATVCLILYEITFRGVLPPQIVPYMQLALIAAVLLATFVAGKKFVGALKKGKGITEDKALVRGFYKAWAEKDAGKRNAAFDRVLHPNYRYRDYGTGEILDADGLKERADRDHNEFRKIRFVFGDQSSGEGSIGSRITRITEPEVGGARAADETAFLDVSRVEGGTIARQLNKVLAPAPPGPVERSLAGLRESLKRPRPDGRTNPVADGGSERATDGGARRGETG